MVFSISIPAPEQIRGIYTIPSSPATSSKDSATDHNFVIHAADGFTLIGDDPALKKLIPSSSPIVSGSVFVTPKHICYATSQTNWKRIPLKENNDDDSEEKLSFKRESFKKKYNDIIILESGKLQWIEEKKQYEIPYLTTAEEIIICTKDETSCFLFLRTSTSTANAGNNIFCIHVQQGTGMVGTPVVVSPTVLPEWSTKTEGWNSGILCDDKVLLFRSGTVTLIGTLPVAERTLTCEDSIVEFRKAGAKLEASIRNLQLGFVKSKFMTKLPGVPEIAAVSKKGICTKIGQNVIITQIKNEKRSLRDIYVTESVKRIKVTRKAEGFWGWVNVVTKKMSADESLEESDKILEQKKKINNGKQKIMEDILTDIENNTIPLTPGFLYCIKKLEFNDVINTLLREDTLIEKDRITILSEFPEWITIALLQEYAPDDMRNALRQLKNEALIKIVPILLNIVKAYHFVGPQLQEMEKSSPSYDSIVKFLELLVDARLMDLVSLIETKEILTLKRFLLFSAKRQVDVGKIEGNIDAFLGHKHGIVENEPIEIWEIPF